MKRTNESNWFIVIALLMDGSDGQDGKTDIGKIRAVGPMSPNILKNKEVPGLQRHRARGNL